MRDRYYVVWCVFDRQRCSTLCSHHKYVLTVKFFELEFFGSTFFAYAFLLSHVLNIYTSFFNFLLCKNTPILFNCWAHNFYHTGFISDERAVMQSHISCVSCDSAANCNRHLFRTSMIIYRVKRSFRYTNMYF